MFSLLTKTKVCFLPVISTLHFLEISKQVSSDDNYVLYLMLYIFLAGFLYTVVYFGRPYVLKIAHAESLYLMAEILDF